MKFRLEGRRTRVSGTCRQRCLYKLLPVWVITYRKKHLCGDLDGQKRQKREKRKKVVDKKGAEWYSIEVGRKKPAGTTEDWRMTERELKKVWKKFLTKGSRCAKLQNRRTKWRVPCKLNNVTENTKHQKGFGCFKALKKACENNRQLISLKLWF